MSFIPGAMVTHQTHTLTLCNGKNQVPLLQELFVKSRRSKQKVCDGSQTGSTNGWLDVLLQMWDLLRQNQKKKQFTITESPTNKSSLNPEVTNMIFVFTLHGLMATFPLLEVTADIEAFLFRVCDVRNTINLNQTGLQIKCKFLFFLPISPRDLWSGSTAGLH